MPTRRVMGALRTHAVVIAIVLAALGLTALTVLLVDTKVSGSLAAGDMAAIYYGFILGAAAIVFAIAFADARYWPDIGQLARYCWLRTWLFLGAAAMVLSWVAAMLDNDGIGRAAAAVWVAAALLGTFSLMRVVKLSNATTLTGVMSEQLLTRVRKGRPIESFHLATREALAQGDPLRILDLTSQVSHIRRHAPELRVGRELQASYASAVVRASLVGDFDGSTAGHAVRDCLFAYAPEWVQPADPADLLPTVIIESAPTVARFEHRARMLAEDGVASVTNAMDVRNAALSVHENLRLLFDPEPKQNQQDVGEIALDLEVDRVLACYRALTIRPVPGASGACYSLYQHLSGRRFGGDYYAGAPILREVKQLPALSERAAVALEIIVAEQVVTCTSRLGHPPSGAGWYRADADRTVRGVMRIAASLGTFPSARQALRSWVSLTAQLHEHVPGFAHPPLRPAGPVLAVGLAISHLARLAVVDKGAPERCQAFLELLPRTVAPLVLHRLEELLGGVPVDGKVPEAAVWPLLVSAAGPEEG